MHPAFKKLLEEQRDIEAKKREEILISLGLYEEREERVYAEGVFFKPSDAQYAGYGEVELVDGKPRYYRTEKIRTPIELTDDEYALACKIYRARKAEASQKAPAQGETPQKAKDATEEFELTGTTTANGSADRFASNLYKNLAILCWVVGGILAIVVGTASHSFGLFFAWFAAFFFAGLFAFAMSRIIEAVETIAANTGGQKISLKKGSK